MEMEEVGLLEDTLKKPMLPEEISQSCRDDNVVCPPMYKNGHTSRSDSVNYRPDSLTCIVFKVMKNNTMDHLGNVV